MLGRQFFDSLEYFPAIGISLRLGIRDGSHAVLSRKEIGGLVKLAFIGQPEYFSFIYDGEWQGIDKRSFTMRFNQVHADYQDLIDYKADINYFFRGEFVPDSVLAALSGLCVNLSSEPFPKCFNGQLQYTKDSLARYLVFRTIREKRFDYVFHYDGASLEFIRKDNLFLSGEFPLPVSLDVYRKFELPKIWDLFFIGRSSNHRETYFGPLKHHYHFLHIAHGVWGKTMVNYANQARIALNMHAENEISWEPRVQILLAMGCFVLSEKLTTNKIIIPGADYVETTSPSDCFEKVCYYLKHPDEMNKVASHGRSTIYQYLDSEKSFKNLSEKILAAEISKFYQERETFGFPIYLKILKFMK